LAGVTLYKYKHGREDTILRERAKMTRNMREHMLPLVFPEHVPGTGGNPSLA